MKFQEKNSQQKPRAQVVSMSSLCAAGSSPQQILANCLQGRSFVNELGLAPVDREQWNDSNADIPPQFQSSRCLPWFYRSLQNALRDSGWSSFENTGLIFASTTSSVDQWQMELPFIKKDGAQAQTDEGFQEKMRNLVNNQSLGQPLDKINAHFGFTGPQTLISSSCSASLQALALASLWIESSIVDRCIVATTEIISPLTTTGFEALRLISKSVCKPFDRDRRGINLGEAAAVVCLESSLNRNATRTSWGFISGAGFASDAYHATAPHPEGKGAATAVRMALQRANLSPQDIDWIYAHGTASPGNDSAEMKALQSVFIEVPHVVSTKPIHGHTLAASGLLETTVALAAMKEDCAIRNHFTENWDPAFGFAPKEPRSSRSERRAQHILKNSLGFGGINVSVILSRD